MPSMAATSGTAHLGIFRFFAASKLPNIGRPTGRAFFSPGVRNGPSPPPPPPPVALGLSTALALSASSLSLRNGVVFSASRVMVGCSCLGDKKDANQPDWLAEPPPEGAGAGFVDSAG